MDIVSITLVCVKLLLLVKYINLEYAKINVVLWKARVSARR
jgi:hypothetical protein